MTSTSAFTLVKQTKLVSSPMTEMCQKRSSETAVNGQKASAEGAKSIRNIGIGRTEVQFPSGLDENGRARWRTRRVIPREVQSVSGQTEIGATFKICFPCRSDEELLPLWCRTLTSTFFGQK